MQQVGGALGVAILATVALTHSNGLIETGEDPAHALTSGFSNAFYAGIGLAVLGVMGALLLIRARPGEEPVTELQPSAGAAE